MNSFGGYNATLVEVESFEPLEKLTILKNLGKLYQSDRKEFDAIRDVPE